MSSNSTGSGKKSDFGALALFGFAIWAIVALIRGASHAVQNVEPGQVIVLVVIGIVAWSALSGSSSRAGHPPAQFSRRRPELTGFWTVLAGRNTAADDIMLELGLFRRADDGSIIRPTRLEPYLGTHADWVRFTPVPGTAKAWLRAQEELTFLFEQPLFLSSEVAGTFDMGYWHTAPPEPLPPLDHTEQSIWWDDVPDPEIGGTDA